MSGGGHNSTGGRRRKRHEEHEEHVNHERWLITYGDMLTLLMVLFIVLFAVSSVDQKKAAAVLSGIAAGFGATASFAPASTGIMEAEPKANFPNFAEPRTTLAVKPELGQDLGKDFASGKAGTEKAQFEDSVKKIKEELKKAGLLDDVEFQYLSDGSLKIITRDVLFDAGSANLTPAGIKVMGSLGPVLSNAKNKLVVLGHTNQAKGIAAGWRNGIDLSGARAVAVATFLIDREGIPESRFADVSGRGQSDPYIPGDTAEAFEKNKRVEIILLSELSESERALAEQKQQEESAA